MKVFLTGGLGNQLFQLSAAMHLFKGQIELVARVGKPRLNLDSMPEIASFKLPTRVKIITPSTRFLWLSTKVFGLNLRSHFMPRPWERLILPIYRFLGSIYFSLLFSEKIKLRVSDDLGYSNIEELHDSTALIGYFQSYRYFTDDVKSEIGELELQDAGENFHRCIERVNGENLLAVHLRIGDYRLEPNFGILTSEYYKKAFLELESLNVRKAVIFSDSPDNALEFLPKNTKMSFEMAATGLTSAETLKMMASCSHFILANSTFSWWGAALSENSEKCVVAPIPWFVNLQAPRQLLFPEWVRVPR